MCVCVCQCLVSQCLVCVFIGSNLGAGQGLGVLTVVSIRGGGGTLLSTTVGKFTL